MHSMRFSASRGRATRRPEHKWYASHYPWELQPICIAPVLPGEKLLQATYQSRAVTDPLTSSVVGWWLDYYWFYVPLSLLDDYAAFIADVESGDLSGPIATDTTDDAPCYFDATANTLGINWLRQCLDVITREWFREEDEKASTIAIRTGYPAVKIRSSGIEHSLRASADYSAGAALGATQRAQEDAHRAYQFLREQSLTQLDYEDWLRTYGVQAPGALRRRRPILLRYEQKWHYPSNVVNQATGVPVTAVSWVVANRISKRRFFSEPGFIIGLTSAQPKIYRANQQSFAASVMDRLQYWAPAILRDDELTSLREDTATTSPIYDTIAAASHWIDCRDLLIYGDQFLGGNAQSNRLALPTAAFEHKYATQAMVETVASNGIFTNPLDAGQFFVRQDGVVRFAIRGAAEDAVDATAAT